MKYQWIKTTGAVIFALILVAGVNAQPRGGRGQGPDGKGRVQLNLTEEQQEQMKTLKLEHYKTMKPLKAEMVELKARERKLFSANETDMKAVNQVIDDQTALMNKMWKLQAEHKVEGKKILTDEQIMILDHRKQFAAKGKVHARGNRSGRGYHSIHGFGAGQGYGGARPGRGPGSPQ